MQIINIYPLLNSDLIYTQNMGMALTHLVEKYPAYAECFRNYCGFKILDNSIVELGGAVDIKRLMRAAEKICAHEIILPDVFDDGERTVELAIESIEVIKKMKLHNSYHIMAVCQGKDVAEIEKCFETLSKIPEITTIGIPKRFADKHPLGRPYFEYLWADKYPTQKRIHLLGLSGSFTELLEYQHPNKIRSCDTCLATLLVKCDKHFFGRREKNLTLDLEKDFIVSGDIKNFLISSKAHSMGVYDVFTIS